jgi:hypothetical protein
MLELTKSTLTNQHAAVFKEPDQYDQQAKMRYYSDKEQEGIVQVWGRDYKDAGYGLVQIVADAGFWPLKDFKLYLKDKGYQPVKVLEAAPNEVKEGYYMEDELYETRAAAGLRAQMIGCVGAHVHEVDGKIRYMPCDSMEEFTRLTGLSHESADELELVEKAVWTTAYRNDLPDSAFLFIESGGEKDDDGKTTPRTLRKLPYRNDKGNVDMPHLRAALRRLNQTGLSASNRDSVRRRIESLLEEQAS